jgi:hypothetical protein
MSVSTAECEMPSWPAISSYESPQNSRMRMTARWLGRSARMAV